MVEHGPVAHALLRLDKLQGDARAALDKLDGNLAAATSGGHLLEVLHLGLGGARTSREDKVGDVAAAAQLRNPCCPQELFDPPLDANGPPAHTEMAEVDRVLRTVVVEEHSPAAFRLVERRNIDWREEPSQHLGGELLHALCALPRKAVEHLQRRHCEVARARLLTPLCGPYVTSEREAVDLEGQCRALRKPGDPHPGVPLAGGENYEVRDVQYPRDGNEVLEAIHPRLAQLPRAVGHHDLPEVLDEALDPIADCPTLQHKASRGELLFALGDVGLLLCARLFPPPSPLGHGGQARLLERLALEPT
mmetsp:Transcript_123299/g.343363  ORF Transcript_123299/g.343363 Transcript_123299/m.343363 type:complete len:306 (-) Transcript_123299:2-919(-)